MGRSRDPVRERDLRKFAYIKCQNLGWTDSDIRIALGCGKDAEIGKIMKDAIERGYLQESYSCGPNFDPSETEQFQQEVFNSWANRPLQKQLQHLNPKRPINEVYVFTTRQNKRKVANDESEWDHRVAQFGRLAAKLCIDFVCRSKKVGCCFGRQLASLAHGMQFVRTAKINEKAIDVFPVMGDICIPPSNWKERWKASEISATGVAEAIHAVVNTGKENAKRYSLASVPILCPRDYMSRFEDFATVLEFHASEQLSDYLAIFGEASMHRFRGRKITSGTPPASLGLVHEMDCLLATIGGPNPRGRFWTNEFFSLIGEGASSRAEEELLGDVGGVWLPKNNPQRKQSAFKTEVESRWTCLDAEMMNSCYDRGKEGGAVGVVAICVGAERAVVAKAAAASGMVNRLLLDSTCANRLKLLLP